MNEEDFYLRVAHALSGCQLIEQELKLYISEALQLTQMCVAGKLPFSITGEDFQDSPLGRLIDIFAKLSDSPALLADLRKFKAERNFLSHKGIAHCLDYGGDLLYSTAVELQPRLEAIQKEANRLRTAIHEEANKFRAHLWFKDETGS